MTALIALLVLSQSPTIDAEVFVDRGETYIRAGEAHGLQVGIGLEVLDAKSRASIGTAVVMEIWESLARVSLDAKATSHPTLKVVRVSKAAEPLPALAVAEPLPAPAPLPPAQPPVANALIGHVTTNGARLIIYNSSNRDWHNCDVRLPNSRHYRIGDLDAYRDEGVMLFRFEHDGTPYTQSNWVTVQCREGVSRFPLNLY
jgi:hypothetical protein